MKKAICILLSLCVLLPLIGCHVQPTEDPTVPSTEAAPGASTAAEATLPEADPWYAKINFDHYRCYDWTGPVVEMPEAFYYISEDGLYRYDKQSGQDDLLIQDDIWGLSRYEGKVYYFTPKQICCLMDDSGTSTVIWEESMYPYKPSSYLGLFDFQLNDGSLYIKISGIDAIRYILETGETRYFLSSKPDSLYYPDVPPNDYSSLALRGEYCYYIDHSQRTFSIYRMNIDTEQAELVRGDGLTAGVGVYNKWFYDNVVCYHGEIYYTIRRTGDIYRYQEEGNDEMILDLSALEVGLEFIRCTYYPNLCFFTIADGQEHVYEYDEEGNFNLLVSFDKEIFDWQRILVTESAVFWRESESGIVYCEMK